jgi:cytochrome c oxidase subunit 4
MGRQMTNAIATESSSTAPDASSSHAHPNYLGVFVVLCGLTALSVAADVAGGSMGKMTIALVVLAVATAKALFVMLYFMHLKYEGAWKYALLAPTIILAAGIIVALAAEFGAHYYEMLPAFDLPALGNGAERTGLPGH